MMNVENKPMNTGIKLLLGGGFILLWVLLCALLVRTVPAFHKGGWGMWPILFVAMVMVVIAIDRFRYLFGRAGGGSNGAFDSHQRVFSAAIQRELLRGNVAGAITHCRNNDHPLSRIVGAGLAHIHQADREVQEAVDEASLEELPRIEKRTGYLAMIGNIATLLGLLGTIVGLIKSFAGVSLENASDAGAVARAAQFADLVPACQDKVGEALVNCISANKATVLAQGISEAMNCTAFGLLVGIIALIFFSVLNGRTQNLIDHISETSIRLVNLAVLHRGAMNDSNSQG